MTEHVHIFMSRLAWQNREGCLSIIIFAYIILLIELSYRWCFILESLQCLEVLLQGMALYVYTYTF